MSTTSFPTTQKIRKAIIYQTPDDSEYYLANLDTKMELKEFPGPYCMVPYLLVYKRRNATTEWNLYASFPLHHVLGIYYEMEPNS